MTDSLTRLASFLAPFSLVFVLATVDAAAQTARGQRGGRAADAPRPSKSALLKDDLTRGSGPYEEAVRAYLENKEPKIAGGQPAPDGAYPWQVSLRVSWMTDDPVKSHFCGGSVYSDRWIITAAHCLVDMVREKVVVTAGTNIIDSTAMRLPVKRIIMHKSFSRHPYNNDIALVELLTPLPLQGNDRIKAVPLVTPASEGSVLAQGALTVVTGWGMTTSGGDMVRDLRFISGIPVIPRSTCNRTTVYDGMVTTNFFCAGFLTGGTDSCKGDSGGPLTVDTATAPKLAGIVSWGGETGCAQPNRPGVYTRVANYIGWIDACVSNSATCNQ